MCRCTAQPNALCPHVEIFAVATVVFALARLKKNNQKEEEDDHEHFGDFMSWWLTTIAKLSVDVSDVFRHRLRKKDFQ